MGILQSIRSFLADLSGNEEGAKAAQQQVETLTKLAEAKAALFQQQIRTNLRTAGTVENETLPIESVMDSLEETYAYYNTDADNITDTIKNAITKLSPGANQDIAGGVAETVTGLIGGFLGRADGSDTTVGSSKLLTEGLSIVRIDFLAWKFNVQAAGLLKEEAHCASALVLVKSAVDLRKVGLNTFLNLYQNQLRSVLDNKSFQESMNEARTIYNGFREDVGQTEIR